MSWPLASHFSAMLQNPRVAFRDPQLQRAAIEKNEQHQPRPWAGAFAVVYKGLDPDGKGPFAVRVFTTETPERRERYDLISAYLKGRNLRCLVGFDYRDRSIRSAGDGKWYPVIIMEWVSGETLFKWVRARCQEGNGHAIGTVAERWLDAVNELAKFSIAHGDLQHANIMVTATGEVKLVDYDGMCVPALVGRRNLEVGVEPYQHPDRNAHTLLSLELDHFSSLMIYTALRALALQPMLWLKYVEQQGYDKLLFRREDFQNPGNSALYRDLLALGDVELGDLVERLFGLWHARMDQVPPLSQLASSFGRVEQLLRAQQWHAAVEMLNRRGHFRDAPEHLKPLIGEAYQYVCREEAWLAFQHVSGESRELGESGDRALVQAWNESLFRDFPPAEQQRTRVAEARQRVTIVDRLNHLAQEIGGKMTLSGEKRLVAAAADLPRGYAYALRERVRRARHSLKAYLSLERALRTPISEEAIVAAWHALARMNGQSLVDLDTGARIGLAEERLPALKTLAGIPADLPPPERDRQLIAAWREELLSDCLEAEPYRPAYRAALARKRTLPQLQAAIQSGDDVAIFKQARAKCLKDYPLPAEWDAAIHQARANIARLQQMWVALRDGQQAAFQEAVDVPLLRRYQKRFAPHQAVLSQWIEAELQAEGRLGLAPPEGNSALAYADETEGNYRVRWTWPDPHRADCCLLAFCPPETVLDGDPEKLAVHHRALIGRDQYETAGGSCLLTVERAWEGDQVVLWAVAYPAFQKFYSRPLVLGCVEPRPRWKWKGWGLFAASREEPPASAENDVPSSDVK